MKRQIKIISLILISFLLLPGLVHAKEVKAQQIIQMPIHGTSNYNYTSNVTDFEDVLFSKFPLKGGIYSGPHLPPVKFAVSYAGDVIMRIYFSLSYNVFAYGASDYFIYIPILNSPNEISLYVKIDDFTFLDGDYFTPNGWYRDGMNYSVLSAHHLIYYSPGIGYVIHNPFYPLVSGKEHLLYIAIHPLTNKPIMLYLMQGISKFVDYNETQIEVGQIPANKDLEYFDTYKETTHIPIAVGFLLTEGLTSFGIGAVSLPGDLGIYQKILVGQKTNKYATIEMPLHFPSGDFVTINYTWTVQSNVYNKKVNAFIKNFVIQSTDTPVNPPDTGSYAAASFVLYPQEIRKNYTVFISSQKQHDNVFIYDCYHLVTNPDPSNFDKDVSKYTWAFGDADDYATHIITNLTLTENRYVSLNNSDWEISRLHFAKLAIQNGLLLQYYDLAENSHGPLSTVLGSIGSIGEAKELIRSGAKMISSNGNYGVLRVGFTTPINHLPRVFFDIGKIVWQQLMKFWGFIVHQVILFWHWIAPVLQLATYFVFVITLMVTMKYMGKIFIRRS